MTRIVQAIARFATDHRAVVLVAFAGVAVFFGAFLPQLELDPRPQLLTTSSISDQQRIAQTFSSNFGDPDDVVVLLVQADDVLEPDVLAHVHRLSIQFRGKSYVERVEGLTVTSLPLPAEQGGGGESLETLEGLEDEEIEEEPVDPEILDALGVLVQSDPARFELGLATLGERLQAIRFAPAVEGRTMEPEERESLLVALENAPLIEGRLVSRDHTVTAVAIFLNERAQDHRSMTRIVRDIDRVLARERPPAGVTVEVGGLPHIFNAISEKLQADNIRMVPLTVLVCVVLLFLSFRWYPGVILPIVSVGISTLVTVGGMALFNEPMNVLNNVVPPLLIVIGVGEAIHVIGRYREELEHAATKMEAARKTVFHMSLASFLTTSTTAVGLASLITSQTGLLRRFGVIAGIGVMVAYVATIVFLPAAMTLFKPPLPPRNRPGHAMHEVDRGWLEKLIVWLTRKILRRPGRYLIVIGVLGALCIWVAWYVRVDSAILDEFEESDPTFHSTHVMEDKLEGIRPLEIMLTSDDPAIFTDPEVLAAIDDTQRWLASCTVTDDRVRQVHCTERSHGERIVLSTLSPTDYLHESWARAAGDEAALAEPFKSRAQVAALMRLYEQADQSPLDNVMSDDGRIVRIQVRLRDVGAQASLVLIQRLERRLERSFGRHDIDVAMTGEGYTGSVGLSAVVNDLLGSLGTAIVIIFGMMVVLFRSLRLGLISVPANVLPLVGAVAWMVMRDIPLNAATVIVFSIALGMTVDSAIHILARFREEVEIGLLWRPAIMRAARGTGRAIVISSSTLMLGFGVMMFSSFVPVRRFGELIAVSLGLALVSTLIVMPAMLRMGIRKWKPRPQSKLASLALSGGEPKDAGPDREAKDAKAPAPTPDAAPSAKRAKRAKRQPQKP